MLTLFVRVTSMYAGEGMDNHHFTEVHDIYVKDFEMQKGECSCIGASRYRGEAYL